MVKIMSIVPADWQNPQCDAGSYSLTIGAEYLTWSLLMQRCITETPVQLIQMDLFPFLKMVPNMLYNCVLPLL